MSLQIEKVQTRMYRKARVARCSDVDFWYADRIGDVILVREVTWPSAYVEHKSGASVLRSDLQLIRDER